MSNEITTVCGVVSALSDFQVKILQAINAKFLALQRLADLLEQAADLTGLIPNIGALIPISQIDLRLYEQLRSSCPFLNLPPSSQDPSVALGGLQAQVNAAYGRLLSLLNLNPLNRLSKLQAKLDAFQQQFNIAALGGIDFTQCLQAACASAQALNNLSASDVSKIATDYTNNIVNEGGRVLTNTQQDKVSALASAQLQLKALQDTPNLPTLPTTASPPPPVTV